MTRNLPDIVRYLAGAGLLLIAYVVGSFSIARTIAHFAGVP
jgi:hypothetical protein